MAAFIKTKDHLTVVFDNGETTTVYPSNPKYSDIVAALAAKNYEKVRILAIPVAAVKEKIATVNKRVGSGTVEFKNGQVYYNGAPIHNTLTDRIIEMSNEGFDIQPMIRFLENLKKNPSYRAVNELFGFLEKGNLPITEDGHFIAYKKVRADFTDVHTGTFSNAVGQVCEMPRNEVNEDPNQTCSAGLHFCSRSYLSQFGGEKIVVLKINPADVVAIPVDYNESKGRTCRYEVIGELGQGELLEGAFRPSADYVEPADEDDQYDEDDAAWYDGETDEYGNLTTPLPAGASPAHIETDTGEILPVGSAAGTANGASIEKLDPNDGEVMMTYSSLEEASEDTGLEKSAIRRVLKGDRKTAGGYAWKYADVTATPAHPANLAAQHQHGTLKNGQPHDTSVEYDIEEDDDYYDDDEDYYERY